MRAVVYSEAEWVQALLAEAERDLVFLFNIVSGAFGGPLPAPAQSEVPGLLQRISVALIEGGCMVGFGDPSTGTWREAERLKLPKENLAEAILAFYIESPDEAQFLTFAIRRNRGTDA